MKASIRSIVIFCLIAFLPVWAGCFVLYRLGSELGALTTLAFAGFMFMPTIASILTRLLLHEGFTDMHIRPHFRGNIGRYVLAWLLPMVLTVAGAALYFLIRRDLLTLETMKSLPLGALIATFVLMLLGPVLNLIPAFGEELGWRGYLLPKLMTRMPAPLATIITGVIWGLWHAPMIALGHNYGVGYAGYPWIGILLMTLFCVLFGAFLAYLTKKTGSAIPAGLAHGGLNAVASFGVLFTGGGYDPLIGPMPMGLIGGIPVLIAGLVFLFLIAKER